MKRVAGTAVGMALLIALTLCVSLYRTLHAPASVSVVSPMGDYLIESVRVSGLLAPLGRRRLPACHRAGSARERLSHAPFRHAAYRLFDDIRE